MNQVERLQSLIKKKTGELKEVLLSTSVPEVDIGPQCTDPYFCDFIGHCWKHIPEDSVFDVAGLVGNKKWGLYRNGVVRLVDIWDDFPLNIAQKLQIQSARTGKITWKKNEVDRFVKEFNYPLYFLDFESFQSPVPLYDNTRPYQQIPFQYSLHILDKKDGAVEHKEFLAKAGPDPRPDFVEYLLADLKDSGSIVVYNKSFEKRILLDIARDFPVYRKRLELIIPRMRDLMEPFRQKMIYMPQMRGSYSIKNVYPALVPGAGYQGLEIAEGSSASLAYEGLTKQPDEAIVERTRLNLLNYCRMDTLAMVEIWQAISV
jgi:hypothetical protein